MSQYIRYPNINGTLLFNTFSDFTYNVPDGSLGLALDTDILYAFNAGLATWITIGGPGSILSIGVLDSQTASVNGAVIATNILVMQSASATRPGLINNTTQTFSGNKTFTGTISASNLSGTNTGNITLGAFGSSPSATGASLSGQILTLQPADGTHPGLLSIISQTIAGAKTFTSAMNITGSSDAVQLTIFGNSTQTNNVVEIITSGFSYLFRLGPTGDIINAGALTAGGLIIGASYRGQVAATATSGLFNLANLEKIAFRNNLNNADKSLSLDGSNLFQFDSGLNSSGNITGLNLSGTNTGNITLTAVGSAPDANAATLSGQALTLQPADGTHPGVLTIGAQTIGGAKTFSSTISASNLSGTNTGDQTITLTGDVGGSGTSGITTTIGSNKILNSMLNTATTKTIKSNITAGTTNVSDNTSAAVYSILRSTIAKTSSYALGADDDVISFDATGASRIATLPTAVGIAGKTYTIYALGVGTNNVEIDTTSSQTVGGRASGDIVLRLQGDYIQVQSDNANWQILNKKETQIRSISANMTYATIATDGNYGQLACSLALTYGVWELSGTYDINVGTTGSGIGMYGESGFYAADGANSSSQPTALTAGNIQGSADFTNFEIGNTPVNMPASFIASSRVPSPTNTLVIQMSSTTTVYLVPRGKISVSAGNAIITGYFKAKRLW